MRLGDPGFIRTRVPLEEQKGGQRIQKTCHLCHDTEQHCFSSSSSLLTVKGSFKRVFLGVESWGHSQPAFLSSVRKILPHQRSTYLGIPLRIKGGVDFGLCWCLSPTLIQGEKARRNEKEMATGLTPRHYHTSETTLNQNPSESPRTKKPKLSSGMPGAPLPAGRTNHRTAPGPDLGAHFPVTSGLTPRPLPDIAEQGAHLRGSAALFTLVIPTPTTNTRRRGQDCEAARGMAQVVQDRGGCSRS